MSRHLGLLSACVFAAALLSSSAFAASASVGEGKACGGLGGIQCHSGLFCQMTTGQCHIADAAGTCALRPGTCLGTSKPVCGCDGKTYQSECRAFQSGVNVASRGVCPKP